MTRRFTRDNEEVMIKHEILVMSNGPHHISVNGDSGHISDGYHTFDELYEQRTALFICLCRNLSKVQNILIHGTDMPHCWCSPRKEVLLPTGNIVIHHKSYSVWKSKVHSDGSGYDGWFVMGINKDKGDQITYHLPLKYWETCSFAPTLEKAPDFDGHTSTDVINRLMNL